MRCPGRSVSRTGCATCRRRKVRCDERRGVCGNCTRLGITCEWYPTGDIAHRSRVNTACERCRKNKIRCTTLSSAAGPCAPCQTAMVDCINTNQGIGSARSVRGGSKTPAAEAAGMMSPSSIRSASLASLSSLPSGARPLAPSPAPHAVMPAPPPPPLPRGHSSNLLPDLVEQRRLINAYFDGPHYFCFYTFIHPPTLMQLFDNRMVPDFLLLIILATALRFLDPRDRRADAWADECRRLVMLEIFSPPSTTTLQALLLLQRFEWHRASHVAAWFLSGLAVRLAHGLQLNLEIAQNTGGSSSNGDSREGRAVPVTVREARRRLIWSCFVMESLIENGRRPLSSMDAGAIEVRLPCNEQAFRLGLETDMPTLSRLTTKEHQQPPEAPLPLLPAPSASVVESRLGISTYLVQLAAMRRAVLDYTMPYHPRNKHHVAAAMAAASNTSAAGSAASSASSPSSPSSSVQGVPWTAGSLFFAYEDQLNRWHEGLPPEMRFTAEMLYRRRSSQLVSFVTLHCLYHGCYCDLYRIGSYVSSLHRLSTPSTATAPPAEFLADCRRGRVQHALAICRVIRESMQHQPAGHDPVVGISASLALRVLVIERQHDEDALLGVTAPLLTEYLDAAVACAQEIAQRSVPIRDLFYSVCALARKHGYDVGVPDPNAKQASVEDTDGEGDSTDKDNSRGDRAASPSLRTYGTFGRIQSSLACRKDVLAPAASIATDKESDLFQHYAKDNEDAPPQPPSNTLPPDLSAIISPPPALPPTADHLPPENTDDAWRLNGNGNGDNNGGWPYQPIQQQPPPPQPYGYPAYETYSPNELGVASAWGDGTLNFSMTPTQFDWINQSLGFDFNGGVFGNL